MKTFDQARLNPAALAHQLHALGFTAPGAQQLLASQVMSDLRDRRRLAVVLTRLLDTRAIQAAVQGPHAAIKTASGVVIELDDDA